MGRGEGVHRVKANVFNIDTNEYEELEFEVSDDVYKIITNGIGASYSIGGNRESDAAGEFYEDRPDTFTKWKRLQCRIEGTDAYRAVIEMLHFRGRRVERPQTREGSGD